MKALDKLIRPIAAKVIKQYGTVISYVRVQQGGYDVDTATSIPYESTTTHNAIVEDYSLVDSGAGFSQGLIEGSDKKVTIAASDFAFSPSPGDKLIIGEDTYGVLRITTTYSGDLPAAYEIQARR